MTRKHNAIWLTIAALTSIGAGACATTSATEQARERQLEMAEAQADEEVANIDETAASKTDRVENDADAQQGRVDAIAENKKEEIGQEASRDSYTIEAREQLQKMAVRLDEAAEKAQIKADVTDKSFQDEIQEARTEHSSLADRVSDLGSISEDNWDSTKADIDKELGMLQGRIDDLMTRIEQA